MLHLTLLCLSFATAQDAPAPAPPPAPAPAPESAPATPAPDPAPVAPAPDPAPVAPAPEPAPAASAPAPAASAPAPDAGRVLDRVAAVVNDEIVTLGEVYELGVAYIDEAVAGGGEPARSQAERDVLERLIERRLVAQEMSNLKLDLNEQDIDRSIDDIARRNGLDREGLRAEIERSGIAWDQYRVELRENLRDMKFAQAVLRPRITITDDELKDAWLRATQGSPQATHMLAIFLAFPKDADDAGKAAVLARADAIRAEAAAGADFAALATKYDEGPFGAQGGEMGTFKAGELVDELDRAMQATADGQVSAPVVAGQGVFLLHVLGRASVGGDFETMKEQLADQVFMTRMEDEKERWFQQARRRAAVRVLLTS